MEQKQLSVPVGPKMGSEFALRFREANPDLIERLYRTRGTQVAKSGFLYFIGSDDGPIKIGATVNLERRLRVLQAASPHKLKILCKVAGGAGSEGFYHRQFARHRLHGEWFAPHPDILAEIERLAA